MKPLVNLFQDSVGRFPEQIAVHHAARDWTFAELGHVALTVAAWLQEQGLQRGERVSILLPNSAEYVASYFGVLLAGGVVVGLNPDTTSRELATTLGHCGAAGIVVSAKSVEHFRGAASSLSDVRMVLQTEGSVDLPSRSTAVLSTLPRKAADHVRPQVPALDDVAMIMYTSGTTSHPKGVTLTHRNLAANCESIVQYLELTSSDSVFVILPFVYSYGNSLLVTHVAVGGRLIIASDFVFWNRALDLMEAQQATGLAGVPSSYALLLQRSNFSQRAFRHLRYLTCAGGGLPAADVKRLRAAVPHARLFLMYGQTEASARLSTLMPEELDARPGSIGKGIPGVKLSVLNEEDQPVQPGDVGEMVARGDNVMVGYWNDPEETRRVLGPHGLRTGDLARVDADGYVYIVGRQSDMIKSGAYRINPNELEEIILELAGIAEVAVVGQPDALLGEAPVAFVVPLANGPVPSVDDVILHCCRQLPRYKHLRGVRFVQSLPRTSSGKVRRVQLRETLLATASATTGDPGGDTCRS